MYRIIESYGCLAYIYILIRKSILLLKIEGKVGWEIPDQQAKEQTKTEAPSRGTKQGEQDYGDPCCRCFFFFLIIS